MGNESDLKRILTFLKAILSARREVRCTMTKWVVLWFKCVRNMWRWYQQLLRYNHLRLLVVVAWCMKNNVTEHCYQLTRVSFNKCCEVLKPHGICYRCWRKGNMAHRYASTCAQLTYVTASFPVYTVTMWKKTMWMDSHSTGGMRTYCVCPGDVAVKTENSDTFCCPNICLLDI